MEKAGLVLKKQIEGQIDFFDLLDTDFLEELQIGRASCRERVCLYV